MSLQDDVRNLAANSTLRVLEPEALRLIAFSAETRILRGGDILFQAGDISDGGYVVLSGGIALEEASGKLQMARPPTLIGDIALVSETRRPCTAKAREPSSVLKISRALFQRVLTEFPISADRFAAAFHERVRSLGYDLQDLHRALTQQEYS